MPDDLDAYLDPLPRARRGAKLSPTQISDTLRQAGWDERHIPTMTAIAQAESAGDPAAHNPKYPDDSYGLLQVNRLAHPQYSPDTLKDPLGNARAGLDVFNKQGFGAWSTYKSGEYKKHLSRSQQPTSDLDKYLDPVSGQSSPRTSAETKRVSAPPRATAAPATIEQALDILAQSTTRATERLKRRAAQLPQIQATGTSGIGELRRLDDPEAQRITRIQREITAKEPGSRYFPLDTARRAAQLASREREDELKAQANEPRLRELAAAYRKEIQKAKGLGIGPEQWLSEAAAKGAAGLTELVAGAFRTTPTLRITSRLLGDTNRADIIALHAQAMQRAAEEEGADRNRVSKTIQNVVGGTIASAPELGMMSLGAPPMAAFGLGSATRAAGRGERPLDVARAGAHGVATGAAFELPLPKVANPVGRAALRAGTTGLATGGLEAQTGQPLDKAVETGLTNALMAAGGELVHGRRSPSSLEQGLAREPIREQVEPDAVVAAKLRGERPANGRILGEQKQPIEDYLDEPQAQVQPPVESPRASVKAFITRADEAALRARGYSQQEINAMKPVEAERILSEPPIQTKPPVEAQRETVPANVGDASAVLPAEVPAGTAGKVSESGTQAARFYHKDYGEVTEAPNQKRVGKGRVRVVAEDGSEHVVRRPDGAGAGNQRAVPIKAEPKAETRSLPELRKGKNYRKPLKDYADTLYREVGAGKALEVLPTSRISTDLSADRIYFANHPDLALGQGGNKGVRLEFDPAELQGTVNTSKPAWESLYNQGQAELVGQYNKQGDYQRALKAVTVSPDVKMSRVERAQLDRALNEMIEQGWSKTVNEDGSATYSRTVPIKPEPPISPWEVPREPLSAKSVIEPVTRRPNAGKESDSLSQFVRRQGGIVPAEMYKGELNRLRKRETGTTGLINQNARQGNVKQTADIIMQAANDAGFRDKNGQPFENPGDFLRAVERDVAGEKTYSTQRETEAAFEKAQAQYYKDQQAAYDAEIARTEFLESGRGAELFDKILDRKATDADQQELVRLAEERGIHRAEVEDLIATAREEAGELEAYGSARPTTKAEQLGFVQEGLTQESAPPSRLPDQRARLLREEQDRQAALNPERVQAQAKLDELRRRGMTVEDYARQPDLEGKLPDAAELKTLRELESGPSKQQPEPQFPLQSKQSQMPDQYALRTPIKGQTGAEIIGYRWNSREGERYSEREGGLIPARVSNWEDAGRSEGTGRQIVHEYFVRHPDGRISIEGVKSAQNILGINESRLQAIAKREREAQVARARQLEDHARAIESNAKDSAAEAAQDYRRRNYSPMRSFEQNDALFQESTPLERDGKHIRVSPSNVTLMKERGWDKSTGRSRKSEAGILNVSPEKVEYKPATTPILKDVERATMGQPDRPTLRSVGRRVVSETQRRLIAEFTPLRELESDLYGKEKVPVVNMARKFEQVAGAPAKAQADIFDFKRNVIEPIKRSADDFNSFLFLKRVEDRLLKDPERKRVADWTIEKAQQGLNELRAKVGDETYRQLERSGDAYQREMDKALRLQVESGRMSEELYEAIKDSNDFYAPFKVLRYVEENDFMQGSGRRVATTQELSKKITGIDSEDFQLGNILQTSAEQIVRSRILAEKNLKMLELDKLVDIDPKGDLIRRVEGDERPRHGYEFVRFLKDGEPVALEVKHNVADAVQGLNPKQAGLLTQAMMLARKPLQVGATSANAGFQAVNLLFADLPRSALVSRYGLRNPADIVKFPLDWAHSLFSSMKGNFDRPNKLYTEFLRSGAANSTIQRSLTPEAFRPTLGIAKPGVRHLARSVIDSVAKFSNAIEETSKVLGLKRGMRIEQIEKLPPAERQAAIEKIAAEVRNYSGSPDFARKGADTRDLNLLFMFFNARLQGITADLSRLAGKTGTKEAAAAWARLGVVIGIPTTMLAVLNHQPGYKEDYDKIPDWEKKNYWMIPRESYFTTEDGEKIRDYWRIPKRELGQIFGNTIESAVDFGFKRDPKAAKDWGVDMLENLSPINVQGRNAGERLESAFASTNPALKLPAEALMNRDTFRHRDIVPEYMKGAEPSEQYRVTTPRPYVKAGQYLNISPLQLEHATEGLTGSAMGQFSIRPPLPGRSPASQYPVLRRFFRSGAIAEDTGTQERVSAFERAETTTQVKRRREAIETLQSWKDLSNEEIAGRMRELKNRDPKLAEKVQDMRDEVDKGITFLDKKIKMLGVESGARQAFIDGELASKSPDERAAYLAELKRKGLLPKHGRGRADRPARESRPSREARQ